MRISDVIGLLAALIGSTATLLAAWAYIRSQHPPKGELLRAAFAIIVIMAGILGFAMFISFATIKVNGQDTISVPSLPAPSFLAPRETTPTPVRTSTPTFTPTSTLSPSPSTALTPSTTLTPSLSPSPTLAALPTPSPTPKPKKK